MHLTRNLIKANTGQYTGISLSGQPTKVVEMLLQENFLQSFKRKLYAKVLLVTFLHKEITAD